VIEEQAPIQLETRRQRKDGTVLDVAISVAPLRNGRGEISGTVAIIADITERKRAEEALRASEKRFRALLENSWDAVSLSSADGTVFYTTPSNARILGYTPLEFAGRNGYQMVHPDDLEDGRVLRDELLREPGNRVGTRYRCRHKDGTWRWLEATCTNLLADPDVQAIVTNYRDITAVVEAEEAMRERVRHAAFSAEVGVAMGEGAGLSRMLDRCVCAMVEHLDAAIARIWTLNAEEDMLELQASAGLTVALDDPGARIPVGHWNAGRVARKRRPHLTNGVSDDESYELREWVQQEGLAAYAGYPLIVEDRLVGVIAMFARQPLTEAAQGALASVADVIALGIERKRAEEALQQTARRLGILMDTARSIGSTLNLEALLGQLLRRLVRDVPAADFGVVTLYEPQSDELVSAACIGLDAAAYRQYRLQPGEGIAGKVFQTGCSVLLSAPEEVNALQGALRPENTRHWEQVDTPRRVVSGVCVPLRVPTGETIGTLGLGSTHAAFRAEDLTLLEGVAAQTAVAIQDARLFEQAQASQARMQALSHRLVELQETERRQIARELHDEVGQLLTRLKLSLDLAVRLPADRLPETLNDAQTLAAELMRRVRELSLDLRPAMLDDLGLLPALLWHSERYTAQTNVRVKLEQQGLERRFRAEIETAAYRIVQEALTNVARHAGVEEVTVRLWATLDRLGVQIEDQGAGFDPDAALAARASSGLAGMRERALLAGGHLLVEAGPGSGTRLTAQFPLGDAAREIGSGG
jgi:PAS domain S-box-containing protein